MGRVKGIPNNRPGVKLYQAPRPWVELAEGRTRDIVREAVRYYGAAGMASAVTSAYLQGCEDMARAIADPRPRLAAMEVEGGAGI